MLHSTCTFFSQLFEGGILSNFTFGVPDTVPGLRVERKGGKTDNWISKKYLLICPPVWGKSVPQKHNVLWNTQVSLWGNKNTVLQNL